MRFIFLFFLMISFSHGFNGKRNGLILGGELGVANVSYETKVEFYTGGWDSKNYKSNSNFTFGLNIGVGFLDDFSVNIRYDIHDFSYPKYEVVLDSLSLFGDIPISRVGEYDNVVHFIGLGANYYPFLIERAWIKVSPYMQFLLGELFYMKDGAYEGRSLGLGLGAGISFGHAELGLQWLNGTRKDSRSVLKTNTLRILVSFLVF